MKSYRYVFIGATAFAAGIAAALSDAGVDSLIVDHGSIPAAEFAVALKTGGRMVDYEPVSPRAKALKAELLARDAIAENGDCLPALEPIFCELLAALNPKAGKGGHVDIMTASDVIADDGGTLEISTIGGVFGVKAGAVLDTTSAACRVVRRTLNANLDCTAEEAASGAADIVGGRFENEYYLRYKGGADYTAARAGLLAWWRARPKALEAARLVYIADRFDEICEPVLIKKAEYRYALASVSYLHALEAFDCGVLFAEKIGEELK